MESWNHIVNTALLGTEKRALKKEDLISDAGAYFDLIIERAESKEEAFLQTASLLYNIRQCGFTPMRKEGILFAKAEEEEKSYANELAHRVLYDILETTSISLFRFWLELCAEGNKIVQPETIPLLFDEGMKNKSIRPLIYDCSGKRGEWLLQFNPEWKYVDTSTNEELWQTGVLEQRKNILAELRKIDPAKARELLQQTWLQENAAAKAELLQQLKNNPSNDDLPFLEMLLNEKSVKVKEAVLDVLKLIPDSSVVQMYWNILRQSVKLSASKGILGIGSKTSLEIKLMDVDEAIFKTGIQQLPSEANITDEAFILYQLVGLVPPNFWETYLDADKEKIIELFLKSDKGKALIPALGLAASRFKDLDWLRTIMRADEKGMHLDAFSLLPQKEAEMYALKFLQSDNEAASVLHLIDKFSQEWSVDFSKAVLKFTAKNPYQYHKGFYNQIVHLFPVPVVGELEKCTPQEEHLRTMWSNLSKYITHLLTLKLQTLKAFNE